MIYSKKIIIFTHTSLNIKKWIDDTKKLIIFTHSGVLQNYQKVNRNRKDMNPKVLLTYLHFIHKVKVKWSSNSIRYFNNLYYSKKLSRISDMLSYLFLSYRWDPLKKFTTRLYKVGTYFRKQNSFYHRQSHHHNFYCHH